MADELRLHEWTTLQSSVDEPAAVGLGQVHIGLFSTDPQPQRSADGQIAVVFFGELDYRDELLQRYAASPANDAALILHMYQQRGAELVHELQGVFVLALWDASRKRLLVVNDRFGLLPTYYAHYDGQLVFAPQVKALLVDPHFERQLDLTALAQFVRFQRLLGDRTFFEGVHLLPYASVLQFDAASDTLHVSHYWDFDRLPAWDPATTFEDAVVETGRLLRRAVCERMSGEMPVGVYLSGGLDSRTLLGLAAQIRPPVVSLTYGVPGCRDAIYARRIARRVKSRHHFVPLTNGSWIPQAVDDHLRATEGFVTWTHCHAALTLPTARSLMAVNLSGHGGDQVLGGRGLQYAPLLCQAPDEVAFFCHTFTYLNQRFSWPGIDEAEEQALYTPPFRHLCGLAWTSLVAELSLWNSFPPAQRWDLFTTVYQGTRMSNMNVVFQRTHCEARYPFYDYQLFDWVCSMPVEYRLHDRLYLAVVNREIPEVTWVPRDKDDRLLTDHRWIREGHGLWQRIRRRLVRDRRPTIHEDPEGWLRRDLREWAETLLLGPRTLERGIFAPAFLRSILARQMSGNETHTIGKIAPLMTYEMMLRQFYD